MFRAGVTAVQVDVQVRDGKRLITGLTADSFVVYDQGVPQKTLYFGRETEPLDLFLLLDISGSMRRYIEQMASTSRQALKQLLPNDRVAVMLFARRAEVRADFTTNLQAVQRELKDAVQQSGLGSGTAINASILAAAKHFEQEAGVSADRPARRGRRAILILTDNQSLNYQVPDEKVIRSLSAADITLNAIVVGRGERPTPPKPGQYVNPDFTPSDVFLLAEETGGEAIKADRADASFREMIESIRTRYTLQYQAPQAQPGSFRRIRVELAHTVRARYPGAVVRARSGYYIRQ